MAGLSIWHVLIFAIVVILLLVQPNLRTGKDVGGAVTLKINPGRREMHSSTQ